MTHRSSWSILGWARHLVQVRYAKSHLEPCVMFLQKFSCRSHMTKVLTAGVLASSSTWCFRGTCLSTQLMTRKLDARQYINKFNSPIRFGKTSQQRPKTWWRSSCTRSVWREFKLQTLSTTLGSAGQTQPSVRWEATLLKTVTIWWSSSPTPTWTLTQLSKQTRIAGADTAATRPLPSTAQEVSAAWCQGKTCFPVWTVDQAAATFHHTSRSTSRWTRKQTKTRKCKNELINDRYSHFDTNLSFYGYCVIKIIN